MRQTLPAEFAERVADAKCAIYGRAELRGRTVVGSAIAATCYGGLGFARSARRAALRPRNYACALRNYAYARVIRVHIRNADGPSAMRSRSLLERHVVGAGQREGRIADIPSAPGDPSADFRPARRRVPVHRPLVRHRRLVVA